MADTAMAPAARSGTPFDAMKLSAELPFDAVHRTQLFSGIRLHRPEQDCVVTSPGIGEHVVTVWMDDARWQDRVMLGRALPDEDIGRGSASIMPAGSDWSFRLATLRGSDFNFYIKPRQFEKLFEDAEAGRKQLEIRPTPRTASRFMLRAAEAYLNEVGQNNPFSKLALETIAMTVCVALARDFADVRFDDRPQRRGWESRRVRIAREFIEDNLDQPIGLAEIASAAGLSQYHFVRLFKREQGVTPFQFVRAQRIERAKQLLRTTGDSLCEVALQCGFSSQQHFTSAFSEHCGVSPGRWRQLQRS